MNKIILTGRLTAKPTLQVIKEVNAAKFNIANNDLNGTDTATNFFSCIAWGKKADYIAKYCEKGDKILICGYVKQNKYTNKNGDSVESITITVDTIERIKAKTKRESKSDDDGKESENTEPENEMTEVEDEDLPF